jgi:tetratricopeptide (TPR) repeat protein
MDPVLPNSKIRVLVLSFYLSFPTLAVSQEEASLAKGHAERGMQLAQTGDLKKAEAELRRAVELAPNEPRHLADLGGVLVMQHRLEEANTCFERSLKLDPNNLDIRRNLGANRWQLGDLEGAQKSLEGVLRVKPGDKPTILLLGMVAENRKDYVGAARLLESVPELVVQRSESVAALARSYYNTQQREKARKTLKGLLDRPSDSNGIFLAGQVAADANDSETAERLFRFIESTFPDKSLLGYSLAQVQYHANLFSKSRSTLLDLIERGYETSDIYNLLGWCYLKLDQRRQSVRAFDQAIDLEPSKESNYLDLGLILTDSNLLTVALAVANKALERIPGSYRAYILKGLVETKQGDYNNAVKSYSRALELNPKAQEANRGLAKAQLKAGWDQQAMATFERGIKRFPRDALHYQEYALMLLKSADTGDAAAEARGLGLLQMALAIDGSLTESHYQLGNRALSKGQMKQALEQLEIAANLDPQSAKVHYALARTYRRLGREDEALKESQLHAKLKADEEKSNKIQAASD